MLENDISTFNFALSRCFSVTNGILIVQKRVVDDIIQSFPRSTISIVRQEIEVEQFRSGNPFPSNLLIFHNLLGKHNFN